MAECKVKLPDKIYKTLENISKNTDEILESTLKAGGKVVLSAAKANLSRAVINSSDRSTGQLKSTLGLSPVDIDDKGRHNVKVGFAEPRNEQPKGGKYSQYQKTNAMVANILEYGRSTTRGGKKIQGARPFMRPASVSSKSTAEQAMSAKFDEEVRKLEVK